MKLHSPHTPCCQADPLSARFHVVFWGYSVKCLLVRLGKKLEFTLNGLRTHNRVISAAELLPLAPVWTGILPLWLGGHCLVCLNRVHCEKVRVTVGWDRLQHYNRYRTNSKKNNSSRDEMYETNSSTHLDTLQNKHTDCKGTKYSHSFKQNTEIQKKLDSTSTCDRL